MIGFDHGLTSYLEKCPPGLRNDKKKSRLSNNKIKAGYSENVKYLPDIVIFTSLPLSIVIILSIGLYPLVLLLEKSA